MTGVDTLRAIIKNQGSLADPLTSIDIGRFEWHFSPSEDLPKVTAVDVLSLSHEERVDLIRAATRIYESRFGKSGRCWCAPCATATIPGAALASLLIEEPLISHGRKAGELRYYAWKKLSGINWWCFKGFGFTEEHNAHNGKDGYDLWIKGLAGDSNDYVEDLSKLLRIKEREVDAAKVLLHRLDIDSPQMFLDHVPKNRSARLAKVIENVNRGNLPAAAEIAKAIVHSSLLKMELRNDLLAAIDQCVDLPGFSQKPFMQLMGPFIREDGTGQSILKSWLDTHTTGRNSRRPLNDWMDSQWYHAGLGLLNNLHPDSTVQRTHNLLINEIKGFFESETDCDSSCDALRFLKGILSLYEAGPTPPSTIEMLREIAERNGGPFASTLSKVYMFGFKVPHDREEALRWVALSGEIERFATNCGPDGNAPRSWLISAFATHFMLKGNEIEAVAWGNLSASHPIALAPYGRGTLHNEDWIYNEVANPINPDEWPAGKRLSYEILRKLLVKANDASGYSPNLDPALLARIMGLPPPSFKDTHGNRDSQYRAAFQFFYRRSSRSKDITMYMTDGFREAPVDEAEAFAHVVLLFDVGGDVVKCTKSEDAIGVVMNAANIACNDADWDYDGTPSGDHSFWWADRGFLQLVWDVLRYTSPQDIQRGIERLKLLHH